MKKNSAAWLSALCIIGLLTGCSQAEPGQKASLAKEADSQASADKNSQTAGSESSGKATGSIANESSAAGSGDNNGSKDSANAGAKASSSTAGAATSLATGTAKSGTQPRITVNLNNLPGDMVICTVAGSQVKVRDYSNMLKLQQMQMQANIIANPSLRAGLLKEARNRGLTLTADEKNMLIENEKMRHKDFNAFLKGNNLTEQQFKTEIENAGLSMKMAGKTVEDGMLSQIVSRELLCKASRSAGLEKTADSNYSQLKKTPAFEELQKQTGLSQEDLHSELIKTELAKMQIARLEKSITISESEIKKFYNDNKSQLQHPERVRLSTILISCPDQDTGSIQSVRTQVKQANHKLEGKELDATVAQVVQQQQNKALILLGEAKTAKADFAKLANENSDDIPARMKKDGGDMGWQSKPDLVPQFADAVWELKPGTILPKLVKTNQGFLIIKVTGHEPAGMAPLVEVSSLISSKLKQDKLGQTVNEWIAQQQKTYHIEFSPRFLAIAQGGKDPASKTH